VSADQLSTTLAALANPTRRAILTRLAEGETTVKELAEPFAMSLPGISKHLQVLRDAGLVVQGRDAQWRPCRLDARPLKEVADWVDRYRRYWEERFQVLDDYLAEVQQAEERSRENRYDHRE
jgi:DNA-binding transcriptional ArsR family regulator